MKTLLNFYNNSKFRTKLLWIFVLSSLVPICMILIVSAILNTQNMTDKVNQLMVTNMRQMAQRVNLNLEVYTNLLYQIYQDDEISENIKALMDDDNPRKAVAYNKINSRLKQYNTTEAGVRCISVICADGNAVVYDFERDSYVDNLWSSYADLRQILPYQDAVDEPGMVITPTMTFREKSGKSHYFHISKRVFDWNNPDRGSIATVILSVDEKVLNTICHDGENVSDEDGINFIMAADDTVITYPDEDFSGIRKNPDLTVAEFVNVSGLLKNRNTAVNEYPDPVTGWTFYNVYDKDAMLADVIHTQYLYLLIGFLAIGMASLLVLYLVRQIHKSVSGVVSGMKQVQEGNLKVRVPVLHRDELGEIADNFNSMTEKVNQLIDEVAQNADARRNAEIRALEAQINPHFLYNTLDSINWMAIDHAEYEISKMLRNLGVILRYSIDRSNETVTIKEVSDWLDKYISLQQMRFEGAFVYHIQVEPGMEEKRIYKLLLQPFIENAILHGFRDMETGGVLNVTISGTEDGRQVSIVIEDNGKGMTKEKQSLYNDMEKAAADDGRGIGLQNAFSRMRMYYGEQAQWKVNSMEGMGTAITLKLPV